MLWPLQTPTSEKHKINPLYPYAMSKYLGENCVSWQSLYDLPVNSIRILMLMDQEEKQQASMEQFLSL